MPVPLRARVDGWTPKRQSDFLAALAETRSVLEAARRVSMARESAYRLRRKPGAASFAAAWDAVMGPVAGPVAGRASSSSVGRAAPASRKVTDEHLVRRATLGLLKRLLYGGKHVATVEKADNSALLAVIAQLGRAEQTDTVQAGRSQGFAGATGSTSPRHVAPSRGLAS